MEVEKYISNDEIIIAPKYPKEESRLQKSESDTSEKSIVVNVNNSNAQNYAPKPATTVSSGKVVNKVIYIFLYSFLLDYSSRYYWLI